jgi:hypothetical protein
MIRELELNPETYLGCGRFSAGITIGDCGRLKTVVTWNDCEDKISIGGFGGGWGCGESISGDEVEEART